jgi:hypothetical protein
MAKDTAPASASVAYISSDFGKNETLNLDDGKDVLKNTIMPISYVIDPGYLVLALLGPIVPHDMRFSYPGCLSALNVSLVSFFCHREFGICYNRKTLEEAVSKLETLHEML